MYMSDVKYLGLTEALRLKLYILSMSGVSGIPGVAVNCVEIAKNTGGEGGLLGHS